MKHSLLLFAALLSGLIFSCSADSDLWLDSGNLTGTNVRLIQIDTMQIEMSTFKYDSLVNESANRLLVGQYDDPIFGQTRSEAFIELAPSTYYLDDNAVFDSVVLNLPYDGYFYNDTLVAQNLEIRRLTETIDLANGVSYYYNTSDFETGELLGSKTFRPRISKDSVTVTLSSAFGQDIFRKIQDETLSDVETLTDYFRGLALSPSSTDNASVIGYKADGTYMRLYYSITGDTDSEHYLDLKLNSTATVLKYVNHISSDRTGTPIAGLSGQQNDVGSDAMQDLAYVQGGTGIATKITFPNVRTISQINDDNGAIFKANLKLRVNPAYYNDNMFPSDTMYVGVVSKNNTFMHLLTDAAGANVRAYLERTNPEYNEINLVVPVSEFLNKSLKNVQYLNYGLILLPVGYNTSVTRTVLNGPNNSNYQSKLELTYAIYD